MLPGAAAKSEEIAMGPFARLAVPKHLEFFLTLLGVITLMFMRRPDAFTNPQFWAEDATVFFNDAHVYSFESLTMPANGYYLLYPRLVGLLGLLFPIAYTPHVFNLAALASVIFVVSYLFSHRIELAMKPFMALSIVLAPVTTPESFMTLTNAQWFLALSLLLVVLAQPPKTFLGKSVDLGLVLISGLTGPFIVIYLPFFAVKLWHQRNLHSIVVLCLALLCAFCQVSSLKSLVVPEPTSITFLQFCMVISRYITFTFLGQLGHELLTSDALNITGAAFALAIYAYLLCTGLRNKAWPQLVFTLASALILASVIYKYRTSLMVVDHVAPARYSLLPAITLLWALIASAARRSFISPMLLAVCAFNIILLDTNFSGEPFVNYRWQKRSRCLEIKSHCRIPINPPGWYLNFVRPKG